MSEPHVISANFTTGKRLQFNFELHTYAFHVETCNGRYKNRRPHSASSIGTRGKSQPDGQFGRQLRNAYRVPGGTSATQEGTTTAGEVVLRRQPETGLAYHSPSAGHTYKWRLAMVVNYKTREHAQYIYAYWMHVTLLSTSVS